MLRAYLGQKTGGMCIWYWNESLACTEFNQTSQAIRVVVLYCRSSLVRKKGRGLGVWTILYDGDGYSGELLGGKFTVVREEMKQVSLIIQIKPSKSPCNK